MPTATRLPQQDARELLEDQVREIHAAVLDTESKALRSALTAGGILREIIQKYRKRDYGGKMALYERTCGSARTGRIYTYLVEHESYLENWQSLPVLSIASALARIRERRGTRKATPTQAPVPAAESKPNLSTCSDTELVAEIDKRGGADWLLQTASSGLREQLKDRLAGQLRAQTQLKVQTRKPPRKPFKPVFVPDTRRPSTSARGYAPGKMHLDVPEGVIKAAARKTLARREKARTQGRRVFEGSTEIQGNV